MLGKKPLSEQIFNLLSTTGSSCTDIVNEINSAKSAKELREVIEFDRGGNTIVKLLCAVNNSAYRDSILGALVKSIDKLDSSDLIKTLYDQIEAVTLTESTSSKGASAAASGGEVAGLAAAASSSVQADALTNAKSALDCLLNIIIGLDRVASLVFLLDKKIDDDFTEKVVEKLAQLAFDNESCRQEMVDEGALPGLAELLHSEKAEQAAAALRNISLGGDACAQAIVDAGVLPGLIRSLYSTKGEEAQNAAAALDYIAYHGGCGCRQAIVDAGALPGLVDLLRLDEGGIDDHVFATLRNIALGGYKCCEAIVAADALPCLVGLLRSGEGEEAQNAAAVLDYIAYHGGCRQAIVDAGALPGLVGLLRLDEGGIDDHVFATLRNIALGGYECCKAIVAAGALPCLVGLLGLARGDEAERVVETLANIARADAGYRQEILQILQINELPFLVLIDLLESTNGSVADHMAAILGNADIKCVFDQVHELADREKNQTEARDIHHEAFKQGLISLLKGKLPDEKAVIKLVVNEHGELPEKDTVSIKLLKELAKVMKVEGFDKLVIAAGAKRAVISYFASSAGAAASSALVCATTTMSAAASSATTVLPGNDALCLMGHVGPQDNTIPFACKGMGPS
jgi:hypothetical protein